MGGEARRLRPALLAALLAACALSALLPSPALAALFDPDDWLKGLMTDLVGPRIDDVNRCIAQLTGLSGQGSLANPLTSLFGDEVGRQVYDVATTVMNVIMKPIAGTILAFCLVGQLIKTSQHVNPSSTFPGVMEVAGTLVFFVFFSLTIGYTEQVVALFFETGRKVLNVVNQTASIVAGPAQAVGNIDKEAVLAMVSDPGAGLSIWAEFLVVEVILFGAQVLTTFAVWGRALQIYIMLMVAPVPIALLGADETRHMGIGFFKNFAALCLAAAIMAFVLWLFSIMFAASITEVINTANQLSAVTIGKLLVVCLLLCWALTKSGQFARDVLGG